MYVESNRDFHPWQGNSILGDEVIKSDKKLLWDVFNIEKPECQERFTTRYRSVSLTYSIASPAKRTTLMINNSNHEYLGDGSYVLIQ